MMGIIRLYGWRMWPAITFLGTAVSKSGLIVVSHDFISFEMNIPGAATWLYSMTFTPTRKYYFTKLHLGMENARRCPNCRQSLASALARA
jgi:hypothetical protein